MANTLTLSRQTDQCQFWTPWGPQVTTARDAKLATMRRTLNKLGKARRAGQSGKLDEVYASKPECSYEP